VDAGTQTLTTNAPGDRQSLFASADITLAEGSASTAYMVPTSERAGLLWRCEHDLGRRVENMMADRNDAASLREALSGRRFEVVFDNVYDWERGTTAAQVEATVRACGGDRLNRYIFLSSVAA